MSDVCLIGVYNLSPMDLFTIVLKEDMSVDPRTYGPLLAPALGVTVLEARMAVRRGSGIFAENLPKDEARCLAQSLEEDGIQCWCGPSSSRPRLSAPRLATSVASTGEGRRCARSGQTEPVTLPWDRIGAVSIGPVLLPELQEEIAGIRRKDVAAVAKLEREQRDLVRDRLLGVLNRIDLSHEENAPAASAHHYFFDQLRRKEAKQLKAFADVVSVDGAEWWRIPLEESNFRDGTEGGPEAANYLAAPVLYARRKDAHTDRSRKLFQGGNVERLVFDTMEEFNRHTLWWTWRERLRADPGAAAPAALASTGGNGQAPKPVLERPAPAAVAEAAPRLKWWRSAALAACLTLTVALVLGLKLERRGADCMLCQKQRQDDVIRLWGIPLKESLGEWKKKGPGSAYDRLIGADHAHLYSGFGYERTGMLGIGSGNGRIPVGNASPEDADACECVEALFTWHDVQEATPEEVKAAYPKLYERVRSARDPAKRQRWLDLARARPDREAPENLLKEISK